MGTERRSTQLFTDFGVRSTALSVLLLVCCSDVVAQQTGVISPVREQKSWIVGRGGQNQSELESVVPGCTDLCLNALNPIYNETLVGVPVELYSCQDSDNSLFQYDESSNAILMWDFQSVVNRCLAADQASTTNQFHLTLQECMPNATNQQWFFQQDGTLRSGLVTFTSLGSTESLVMQGQARQLQDWGSGQNVFDLNLGVSGSSSASISFFSLLPYDAPSSRAQLLFTSLALPGNSSEPTNLILNGDFESCGYDPGDGRLADFSSETWWFTICSWAITGGSVQLVSPGVWQQAPSGNNATLHLNGNSGPGTITQSIYAQVGANYSLSFDLAGYVNVSCESKVRTLDVYISPSTLPFTSLSFNVSDKSPTNMGWMAVPPLNFTVSGSFINFTFQSTSSETCGPVIANVAVWKIQGGQSASHKSEILSKALKGAAGGLAAGLLVLALYCSYRAWRKRHTEAHFVKGIRCQSDKDSISASFKAACDSFSVGVFGNHYSWQELETATNNFAMVLGNDGCQTGSFSLYLAEFPDGLLGAVKVDSLQQERPSDEVFKREVVTFQRLHHAYLVNMIGVCIGENGRRGLVFEYMANGNLFDRLHRAPDKDPLSWQMRMVIAYQVACALEYLHEESNPHIIHGDVNAASVLLQCDDSAKLACFDLPKMGRTNGIAALNSSKDASPACQPGGRTVSKKGDVHCYGALLLELITGIPAAEVNWVPSTEFLEETDMIVNIVDPKLQGKFNNHELNEVMSIVTKCQQLEVKLRPTMSDVVCMLRAGFVSSRSLLY